MVPIRIATQSSSRCVLLMFGLHVFSLMVINVDDDGLVIVTRIPDWRLVQVAVIGVRIDKVVDIMCIWMM